MNNAANSLPSDPRYNMEIATFATQIEDDVYQKNLIAFIILLITIILDLVLFAKDKWCKKKEDSTAGKESVKKNEPV